MKNISYLIFLFTLFVQNKNNINCKTEKTIEKNDGKEIVWKKDSKTGVEIFNLGKGFNNQSKKIMNLKLDSIYNKLIEDKTNNINSISYSFKISFVNSNIISFKSTIFEKGLDRFISADSYNYNLKTGKKYKFNELYPRAIIQIILKEEFEKRGTKFDDDYIKFLNENYNKTYFFWQVGKKEILVIVPFTNILEEEKKTLLIPFEKLSKYKKHNLF